MAFNNPHNLFDLMSNPEFEALKDNPEAQSVLLMALLSAQAEGGSPVDESDHQSASSPTASEATEPEKRKFDTIENPPRRVGRKPVTSDDDDSDDPKNKRKAQNRAAQRAFRERKENHVKVLEERVQELEKASNEKNTELQMENKILKEMIERLQNENASLLSFNHPLSTQAGETNHRPQKIARASTHFDSLDPVPSTKHTENLFDTVLPSSTLLDHSELLGNTHLPFDSLFSTDPKQFDLFDKNSLTHTAATDESTDEMVRLWDKMQHANQQEEFDLDGLCDEMKKKAQCSEFNHNKEFSKLVEKQNKY